MICLISPNHLGLPILKLRISESETKPSNCLMIRAAFLRFLLHWWQLVWESPEFRSDLENDWTMPSGICISWTARQRWTRLVQLFVSFFDLWFSNHFGWKFLHRFRCVLVRLVSRNPQCIDWSYLLQNSNDLSQITIYGSFKMLKDLGLLD